MKNTAAQQPSKNSASLVPAGNMLTLTHASKPGATSFAFKTNANPARQHAAIGKLIAMCDASLVVKHASQGSTAEVRRDRDRR